MSYVIPYYNNSHTAFFGVGIERRQSPSTQIYTTGCLVSLEYGAAVSTAEIPLFSAMR